MRPVEYLRSVLAMLVFFLLLLIFTPLVAVLLLISGGYLTNFLIRTVGPILGRPPLAVAGIDLEINDHFHPDSQSVIYIINHSSTLDLLIMISLGLPRVRFVAKYELQYNPLFFVLGRVTGQVFIKRQRSKKAVQILQKAYKRIHRNRLSVLLAPEGSRKHPGKIGPFKKGPFRMAIDLDYPIVPIYVDGARELSKGGSLFTRSGRVTVTIHPPVDTSHWSLDTLEEHIAEVRSKYLEWAGISAEEDQEVMKQHNPDYSRNRQK